MKEITPLIICGGNGTRLWPISRTQSPKQFQRVGDAASLTFFQTAIDRHSSEGFGTPLVVSSAKHTLMLHRQLQQIGRGADVILEPMGRNTGPAVLSAALRQMEKDPDALMLVVPADHVIEGDINSAILAVRAAAEDGYIITFGIKPRYAETGFGYITDGGPIFAHPALREVERFVEKPPTRKARLLVESDIAYWASGISLFKASTIIEEYAQYDPETLEHVKKAVAGGKETPEGLLLDADAFALADDEPTETAVFERTRKIALCPLDVDWSDVGSWTAMYGISNADAQGNVIQGDVIQVETKNCMVRSETRLVTCVGLEDIIVVDTADALLVTKVGHCQSVKKVAQHLKSTSRVEAEKHQRSDFEWGHICQIMERDHMTMCTVSVKPGATMRLDPAPGREAIITTGEVLLTNGRTQARMGEGDRRELCETTPTTLSNPTDGMIEVMVITIAAQSQLQDLASSARYAS
ncbi:sugar phosphate nucleotidyltransferase [Marinovum sp. 2_MG-2023]|uniref:mannose-1-phosphate guanylyltransferase n=1 Tax=Roseobacteraceae TaxID=2854170 RepID=UPI001FD43148|nr:MULTISPECIES: sugar phosphate nucleotidyltransferase [Roseobacteraceae]MCJ7872821.1 sugar phosphate nucleotidyltransferase [Phaeobacter sp. J2-8]MDO6730061.1 sugar phosphate nucleotidyltransferase [Marinovum sp. 2_MG-2023]MDO6779875.1 sugar phosphate nucleotidyltransferase [Marinovum sp. 1_MG-2023]